MIVIRNLLSLADAIEKHTVRKEKVISRCSNLVL
jgi:hypothetical protein